MMPFRFCGSAIETRYLGPTNYRGARIVATADLPVGRTAVPYPYDRNMGSDAHIVAAEALLRRNGLPIGGLVAAATAAGYVFVRADPAPDDVGPVR